MTTPDSTKIARLVLEYQNRAPEDQASFLDEVCGNDSVLRRELERAIQDAPPPQSSASAVDPDATLDLPEPASSGAEDHDCARGQAPSQLAVSSTPRASRGKMQLRAKKLVFKSDDGAVLPKDALGRWDEVPLAHGMCLESLCVSVPFFPVLCFLCMGCTPDR